MSAITVHLYSRLGNAMFGYAYARKRAELSGHELRVSPWIGEAIFTLDGAQHARPDGNEVEKLQGYFQAQKDLIYTRADCRRWFALRPEIERALEEYRYITGPMAHFRRGDYAGAGYPLISRMSVMAAVAQYFPDNKAGIEDVSDEHPVRHPAFTGALEFVPDFYRLMRTLILFRANSTFSWWAATLNPHGRIFAPIITGLTGGVEHDNVPYVEGNWPRLATYEFTTDLNLPE